MSKRDDIEHVVQQLLQDHQGDHRAAFYDLAARFVAVVHGVSPGYMRWPGDDPTREAKPQIAPVDDGSWIKTALGDV